MLIAITHTDFRLYWPARLSSLNSYLKSFGHTLKIIEISGRGSPYFFDDSNKKDVSLDWSCIFPDRKMEDISSTEASNSLWQKLDEIVPDVVLAGAIAFPAGATAVRWCKSRRKPVIIFDNSRLQDVPRNGIVNFIKKCIYRNVDAVISPAPSQAEAFRFWGVERNRIFFGLNVVDNNWFLTRVSKHRSTIDAIRSELRLPDQFFLGVGRLVEKKNWLVLVDAFEKLDQSTPEREWSLVIVGDGPEKNEILNFCKRRQIDNFIIRPFVNQEELSKYYALSSALVLPSKFGETWGLVVNEALASGLPVIVSDQCGCAASLVEDGKNGFLFSPDSTSELTVALQDFMTLTVDDRLAMGKRSQEIISEWSLDRFSQTAWRAIQQGLKYPKKAKLFPDSIIINCWKGRYRPT